MKLTGLLALTCIAGQALAAQSPPTAAEVRPQLRIGDRVRAWTYPSGMPPSPRPGLANLLIGRNPGRLIGEVVADTSADKVTLRRTALVLAPWQARRFTVFWGEVRRVDVAHGRLGREGVVPGAAGGLLTAAVTGVVVSLVSHAACFGERCGPDLGTLIARVALVTVPVGAIWGARTTRWRRVY